jgi:hypothetical protein
MDLAFYGALGSILRGWALAKQGQGEAGLAQLRQGLAAYGVTGAKVMFPYALTLLAEACGQGGQTQERLAVLTEALAAAATTGECFYEQAVVARRPRRPAQFVALAALLQAKLFVLRVGPERLGIGVHRAERTWRGHESGSPGIDDTFALARDIVHVLRHLRPVHLARP